MAFCAKASYYIDARYVSKYDTVTGYVRIFIFYINSNSINTSNLKYTAR